MSKKKKYYVVWTGHKTGVFKSWKECKKNIDGVKGAEYKSFLSIEQATKAYSGEYKDYKGKTIAKPKLSEAEIKLFGEPDMKTISVDAACSGNPGLMEYQGVDTKTKKVIFKQGPYKDSTNNVGEFLALVHGLAYLKKTGNSRPIYSDSRIAIGWVKNKKANTKVKITADNKNTIELIKRAEKWLKTNTYNTKILKWETKAWGEIPADFGRK